MKLKKLIAQVQEYLDADERQRKEKIKHIKSVLKQLRAHEERLYEHLESESDPARIENLKRKIKLAHSQRKKGINMLKELKKQKKEKQGDGDTSSLATD